jgi:transposase InsO family protein
MCAPGLPSRNAGHVGLSVKRGRRSRGPRVRDDEAALTSAIERLAMRYGRYGYRRIRRMLVDEGWRVNVKRVWRIWRRDNQNGAAFGSMMDRACGQTVAVRRCTAVPDRPVRRARAAAAHPVG